MAADIEGRWRALYQSLDDASPPNDMAHLYVAPTGASSAEILDYFADLPERADKFLLVGPKGGGKSTELRAVYEGLKSKCTAILVDLDKSGATAANISAFDLLYISGLALLRVLHTFHAARAQEEFEGLKDAFAGDSPEEKKGLGSLGEALEGLAGFATIAGTTAAAIGLAPGGAPIAAGAIGVVKSGLKLLSRPTPVVPETSPLGERMGRRCREIMAAIRAETTIPVAVLVDGLEKMNGKAPERFRQVFEETRLVANAPCRMVIAAPPCTMTHTNSAEQLGYRTLPVYGFPPADQDKLETMLEKRVDAAGIEPSQLEVGVLRAIVKSAEPLPRHAIWILREAARMALRERAPKLVVAHVEEAEKQLARRLATGLTSDDFEVLERVRRNRRLPGEERAATLFADGRIVVIPEDRFDKWMVHPLLLPLLDKPAEP